MTDENLRVAKRVLPHGAIPATVAFAERTAMLTGELLKILGVAPDRKAQRTVTMPAEFLLELGAVAQLLDWKLKGRSAGPRRNQKMANYADALVAILDTNAENGSPGTRSMIRAASARGIYVFVHRV